MIMTEMCEYLHLSTSSDIEACRFFMLLCLCSSVGLCVCVFVYDFESTEVCSGQLIAQYNQFATSLVLYNVYVNRPKTLWEDDDQAKKIEC